MKTSYRKVTRYLWHWVAMVVLFLLVLFSMSRLEADTSYRIGVMPSSDHWDREKTYLNEDHDGLFLEARLSPSTWIGVLDYTNSFYDHSVAGYWLKEYAINDIFSAGYLIGGVTGYKPNRPMLFGAFTFTIKFGKHVAQRTQIIPFVVNGYQAYVEF